MKPKLIRITTVPLSLAKLLQGQLRFMKHFFDVTGVSSDGELRKEVEEYEGVEVVPITMTRTISPVQDLKSVWALYRLFKKEKPLIVHTHTPKAGTVGMFAAKLAGVPHRFHTVAGLPLLETQGGKRKLLDTVEKITYACATKVYPNSHGLKNIILQQGYTSEKKLKVIGNGSSNGIDTHYFNPGKYTAEQKAALREKLHIGADDFVFVFIGRMVKDKGINELVEAFRKICEPAHSQTHTLTPSPHQPPKLLLIGPLETELDALEKETLQEMDRNPNIIALGYQPDVRPYFAISDALVFPSYREGFPNVVMQAGAMGLPAIVSDINGCNEIIVEGENGTIIPVKDAGAIYKSMLEFLDNGEYVSTLRQNARKMIVDRYEQRVVWEAILEEYRQVTDV